MMLGMSSAAYELPIPFSNELSESIHAQVDWRSIANSFLIKELYLQREQGHECMGQSKQRERK